VIRLSDGRQANSDIIPGRRKRFFSSPKFSDQLWEPPVCLVAVFPIAGNTEKYVDIKDDQLISSLKGHVKLQT
jgi:hypothetical protein